MSGPRSAAARFAVRLAQPAAALLLAGCAERAAPPAPLAFETRRFEDTETDCPERLAPCASIRLEYPALAADGPAAAALDAFVDSTVLAPIDERDGPEADRSPETLMRQFLAGYREFAERYPEAPGAWTLERIARPVWNTAAGFSLEFTETGYTGGAHPNTQVRLVTFDAETGARMRLADLIERGRAEALRALGERAFREIHGLAAGDDLVAAGFWFERGRFELNDNFAVTPAGLRFRFNAYEVAPYALGPTDLTLDRAALAGIARRDGPLAGAPGP